MAKQCSYVSSRCRSSVSAQVHSGKMQSKSLLLMAAMAMRRARPPDIQHVPERPRKHAFWLLRSHSFRVGVVFCHGLRIQCVARGIIRIACLAMAKSMGRRANRMAALAKGRKPDMKRKYVCFIASAAWVGSIAGAMAADVAAGETVFNQKCKVCPRSAKAPRTPSGQS
jgi:hypothetical protein